MVIYFFVFKITIFFHLIDGVLNYRAYSKINELELKKKKKKKKTSHRRPPKISRGVRSCPRPPQLTQISSQMLSPTSTRSRNTRRREK